MKCPQCNREGCIYIESRKKYWSGKKGFIEPNKEPRTNFNAECKQCHWKGIIE